MFAEPEKIIDQLGLNERMTVADLGAGSGAYTVAAARKVTNGRVYAVEVQKELSDRIKSLATSQGLANVQSLWGDIERLGATKLGDRSADAVIASNVLFQVEDRDGMASEVARIVKPAGKVLIIDWKESFGGMGPEPAAVISQSEAQALFEKHGFSYVRDVDAGAHHYGFVMKKDERGA